MEYMKLKDDTIISIEGGAFLDSLMSIADSEEEALTICSAITKDNVSKVEFYMDDAAKPYKSYEYLIITSYPTRQDEIDENEEATGRVIVRFALRTQTEIEKRVSDLESASTDIELALAEIYESIGG